MDKTVTMEMTPDEAAQLCEMMEKCITAIRESNERGAQTEAEIAGLQAETRALLTQLRATLHVEANS